MSDGHEHDAHEGAADAHHDHFDGEPAKELGPDEPMTPGWLPAIGGVLFVALALFGLAESREGLGGAAGAQSGQPAASAAPNTAQTPAQPVQAMPRPEGMPTRPRALPSTMQPPPGAPGAPGSPPAAPGSPEIRRMPPSEVKDMMDRLKKNGGAPPTVPPAGAQPAPGGH